MSEDEHAKIYELIATLDERVSSHLRDDAKWHASIDVKLANNTEITTQIRDIVTSFHTLASLAKWIAVFGSAVAAVVAAWRSLKGGL